VYCTDSSRMVMAEPPRLRRYDLVGFDARFGVSQNMLE
jgi:hypothetical protein